MAGIATRNGILKVSHYINLCKFEGEQFGWPMIVRGSLERLTPVIMTALVAAFALTPLLLAADAPGKEILHPVAVVIFGGLIDQLDHSRFHDHAFTVLYGGSSPVGALSGSGFERKFLGQMGDVAAPISGRQILENHK